MRYVLKFYKDGYLRYTSHLDVLRLFKRSFKRTGIKLAYSQGFNPHPKMSFAQPLSLGYSSVCEYLEFETVESHLPQIIKEELNAILPLGLGVLDCYEIEEQGKTLAALTEYADYKIEVPFDRNIDITSAIKDYMSQENIVGKKFNRKSGKETEVEIKPMIKEISGTVDDNIITLTTKLSAGSQANLSPEMVLSSFCQHAGIAYDRAEVRITREGIYFYS